MTGKPLRLVCVGRVKTDYWKRACEEYAKRLSRYRRLDLVEVRDADSSLGEQKRREAEAARLLAALDPGDTCIVMDERGRDLASEEFAQLLGRLDLKAAGAIAFVIGGPFGLTDEVRRRGRLLLRLGAMTLPHELARVVLLEQLYRAECILHHVPYHH